MEGTSSRHFLGGSRSSGAAHLEPRTGVSGEPEVLVGRGFLTETTPPLAKVVGTLCGWWEGGGQERSLGWQGKMHVTHLWIRDVFKAFL